MFTPHRGGPTVLRIVLGAQLRRLREGLRLTTETAADSIRASHSKISRMELGRVGFKERDVADLLTLYGVSDAQERALLIALAREASKPGWWHDSADILPDWFEPYVGLEEAASVIRNYEVQFVPGLLQSRDYARAVIRLGYPDVPEADVERRVALRISRQGLLSQPEAPRFWAVVDEAALKRPLGGPEVMRGQLKHLMEMTELPNVTLQVVQFCAGGHSAAGGPFSILRFSEPDLPDVVYLEQLTSALYLEKRADVDRYLAVMERLCIEAEPATNTVKVLQRIMDETA
jgi:transcriptional regulator with XRE-family HTH domain